MSTEELIAEAKRRYPIGTRFRSALNGTYESEVKTGEFFEYEKNHITADLRAGVSVYRSGTWAEVIFLPEPVELPINNHYEIY